MRHLHPVKACNYLFAPNVYEVEGSPSGSLKTEVHQSGGVRASVQISVNQVAQAGGRSPCPGGVACGVR